MKEEDVAKALAETSEITTDRDRLSEENARLQNELDEAKTDYAQKLREIKSNAGKGSEAATHQAEEFAQAKLQLEKDRREAKAEAAEQKRKHDLTKRKLTRAKRELTEASAKNDELDAELKLVKEVKAVSTGDGSDSETSKSTQAEKPDQTKSQLVKDLSRTMRQLRNAKKDAEGHASTNRKLTRAKQRLEQKLSKKEKQAAELTKVRQELKELKVANGATVINARKHNTDLMVDNAKLKAELKATRDKPDTLAQTRTQPDSEEVKALRTKLLETQTALEEARKVTAEVGGSAGKAGVRNKALALEPEGRWWDRALSFTYPFTETHVKVSHLMLGTAGLFTCLGNFVGYKRGSKSGLLAAQASETARSKSKSPLSELQGLTTNAMAAGVAGVVVPTLLVAGAVGCCRGRGTKAEASSEAPVSTKKKASRSSRSRSAAASEVSAEEKSGVNYWLEYAEQNPAMVGIVLMLLVLLVVVSCSRKEKDVRQSSVIAAPAPSNARSALALARKFHRAEQRSARRGGAIHL